MTPLGTVLLVLAVVSAFLRARFDQLARRNRETPQPEKAGVHLGRLDEERDKVYTPEGLRDRRLARLFRLLLYAFGMGALLATWFRI